VLAKASRAAGSPSHLSRTRVVTFRVEQGERARSQVPDEGVLVGRDAPGRG